MQVIMPATFEMLNSKSCWILTSRDVKFIAKSIATLPEPKQQPASASNDDNDEDISVWAQVHGFNLIPDEDDEANLVAPNENVDEDEEDDDGNEEEETVVASCLPPTRPIRPCGNFQPFTTQSQPSNNIWDNVSNQLGRKEGEPNASAYDDSLDASSKVHDLEEDHFQPNNFRNTGE